MNQQLQQPKQQCLQAQQELVSIMQGQPSLLVQLLLPLLLLRIVVVMVVVTAIGAGRTLSPTSRMHCILLVVMMMQ